MSSDALCWRTFICTTGSTPFRMRCGVLAVNVLTWNINVVSFDLTCNKHLLYTYTVDCSHIKGKRLSFRIIRKDSFSFRKTNIYFKVSSVLLTSSETSKIRVALKVGCII